LIFGDGFLHATKPGQSDEPVVLLSFTFGTDKMGALAQDFPDSRDSG
jgi:hypothetical protein